LMTAVERHSDKALPAVARASKDKKFHQTSR
jgi:hypothetical protein